ncbi:dolichol-phosphate mannosyltransferase subunit 3 [Peniophora sp. CONT]|nr:dolichol-phosphate mannosyltransferase subunit 3 [Peniophora sp. CONT]
MTRGSRVAAWSSFLTALYLLAFFAYIPVPLVDEQTAGEILPVIPWWLLVSFGSYALYSMGHGLYTFRDADDAYTELLHEISQAKDDLRGKGVSVD